MTLIFRSALSNDIASGLVYRRRHRASIVELASKVSLRMPQMNAPAESRNDDSEALYWLKIARRVLSGEIDPHNARAVLSARREERIKPRIGRPSAPQL